jgi:WD40 repeat protein
MNQKLLITCLLLALLSCITAYLNHEKSFLLQEGASTVWDIAIYKESILLTAVNDIVQKDIETGAIQRTFRGHASTISTFVVTNDSRMITCGLDDMIMVWNLESGSLAKKIWLGSSGTLVISIDVKNDQVISGGNDGKLRSVDLVTGRVNAISSNSLFFSR